MGSNKSLTTDFFSSWEWNYNGFARTCYRVIKAKATLITSLNLLVIDCFELKKAIETDPHVLN